MKSLSIGEQINKLRVVIQWNIIQKLKINDPELRVSTVHLFIMPMENKNKLLKNIYKLCHRYILKYVNLSYLLLRKPTYH